MRLKNAALQTLKVVVSLGLISFLLHRKSPGELAVYLKNIDLLLLSFAVAVFFLSSFLGALQWHLLLVAGGVVLRFQGTFIYYFVGLFFNNFFPANVGGDAIKIIDVVREGSDPHRVFALTLLDRVFGITGLCFLAAVASIIVFPGGTIANAGLYLAIFGGLIFSILIVAFSKKLSGSIRRFSGKIGIWGLGEKIGLVLGHMGSLRARRPLFVGVVLLSLVVQSLRILTHVLVGLALGITLGGIDLAHFFVLVPLLGLIMILPISINGLGVRESAGMVLFTQVGIQEELAVLMEFITYTVQVAVSLIGAVFFFIRKRSGKD
ncbi:MAG: flippase-like domain-containing protein [Candidatus Krumholzibacteria bacterium]|nr:flippase-like domain-containing protein [Candidatus Krumholzibacteria bacterium]